VETNRTKQLSAVCSLTNGLNAPSIIQSRNTMDAHKLLTSPVSVAQSSCLIRRTRRATRRTTRRITRRTTRLPQTNSVRGAISQTEPTVVPPEDHDLLTVETEDRHNLQQLFSTFITFLLAVMCLNRRMLMFQGFSFLRCNKSLSKFMSILSL
jgi:hypothetical protein